jgi:AcrR family transcriptional regulator
MGRPREFDTDAALTAALNVFWKHGFEGASLSALTDAMKITRPSLYAAFGNKEALFRKALDRYQETKMGFVGEALREARIRTAVEKLLRGFAEIMTGDVHPPGCLAINSALACSEEAEPVRLELCSRRQADEAALRRRLMQASESGDLPAGMDPGECASFLMAVMEGMSVQAASGASRETLYGIVQMALHLFPDAG